MVNEQMEDQTYALFRIWGRRLVPSEVTTMTGLRPSYAHAPGELRNYAGAPWPNGMWLLSSEGQGNSDDDRDIETHIVWILDRIEHAISVIADICRQDDVECDLDCTVTIHGNGGVVISPITLGRIAAINVPLGLTVFYVDAR